MAHVTAGHTTPADFIQVFFFFFFFSPANNFPCRCPFLLCDSITFFFISHAVRIIFFFLSFLPFHHLLYLSLLCFCLFLTPFIWKLPEEKITAWRLSSLCSHTNVSLASCNFYYRHFFFFFFSFLASQSFCSTVWPPLGMRCCCGPSTAVYCCWQRTASSSHSVTQSTVGMQWLIKTLTGYIWPFLVPRRCFDGSPLSSGPPL